MIKEFKDKFRWLSNFWPVQIEYKGRIFHNVENAYHSEKSDDSFYKDFCALESNPRTVKDRQNDMIDLRQDWERIKVGIMADLTRIKYQNPELRKKLLETGSEYIQEGNSWGDIFWGIDLETGKGKNILGELVMKIRDEIKYES